MTKRSVAMVVILSCVTFGIYALIWYVKTKNEMNARGAAIPPTKPTNRVAEPAAHKCRDLVGAIRAKI